MPHIVVKLYPGRPEETKKALAQAIVHDVAEIAGCKESSVSVAIEEVTKENWMSEVYDKEIVANQETLVVRPGYGSLSES